MALREIEWEGGLYDMT